jgi:dihydrofolate synthase/folylpolyglutamate synthase
VVIGEKHDETCPVFEKIAEERRAPLYYAEDNLQCVHMTNEMLHTRYHFIKNGVPWMENVQVNLTGAYQQKNLVSALQTLLVLEKEDQIPLLDEEKIRTALMALRRKTTMMGRWEVLGQDPVIIADSAHNQEGLQYAMQQLQSLTYRQLHVVLGAVNDKDLDKMLALFPREGKYYFARPDIPRGLDAEILKEMAARAGLQGQAFSAVHDAMEAAKANAGKEDVIYVGGSTFVVAEVL